LWREIQSDSVQRAQDLVNERFSLSRLLGDEMTTALLSDLDERIACHVLDTYLTRTERIIKTSAWTNMTEYRERRGRAGKTNPRATRA
jgi:hypothetical protein